MTQKPLWGIWDTAAGRLLVAVSDVENDLHFDRGGSVADNYTGVLTVRPGVTENGTAFVTDREDLVDGLLHATTKTRRDKLPFLGISLQLSRRPHTEFRKVRVDPIIPVSPS